MGVRGFGIYINMVLKREEKVRNMERERERTVGKRERERQRNRREGEN